MISQQGIGGFLNINLLVPDAVILAILSLALTQGFLCKFTEMADQKWFAVSMMIVGLITNYILVFMYFFFDDITVFLLGNYWNFFSYLTTTHQNGVILVSSVMMIVFAPVLSYSKRM